MRVTTHTEWAQGVVYGLAIFGVLGWLAWSSCGELVSSDGGSNEAKPPETTKSSAPAVDPVCNQLALSCAGVGPSVDGCTASPSIYPGLGKVKLDAAGDDTDRAETKAFQRAAKATGLSVKEAHVAWEKVSRICPEAL